MSLRFTFIAVAPALVCLAVTATSTKAQTSNAYEFEGYTEPAQVIDVAIDETGTVEEVFVREGDFVEKGTPLLSLNSDLVNARIDLASQQMASIGRLKAAKAEVELTNQRLERIEQLQSTGHARQSEFARAVKEAEVANANLVSVQEDIESRQLEYQRLLAQKARRTVRAPISGFVTEVHREVGEFVAPNKPDVLKIVRLDRLVARFAVNELDAQRLKLDAKVSMELVDHDKRVTGKVRFISPVTEAESGTVLIKVDFPNPRHEVRSGSRCRLIGLK